MNKKPVYKDIHLSRIDTAEFQPPSRVEPKTLTGLIKSISALGMVYHLVVVARGDRFSLVDGHRRHAALAALKESHAYCKILEHDQAEAFAALNGNHRPMRGFDQQEIFLVNPTALTASQQKNQRAAFNYFGEYFYTEVVEKRLAVLTGLKTECTRVERLINAHDPSFLRERTRGWLGARVILFGQRAIGDVTRNKELNDLGKAKRLKKVLS